MMAQLFPDDETSVETYLEYAKEIIKSEAQALFEVSARLNQSFTQAIDCIINRPSSGRVITVGIGKAGHIAQKTSATLSSIGVASFFLHAAEAIHGDLGRLSDDDIVIYFSNSGETPEVLRVVDAIKLSRVFQIAITQSQESTLARYCSYVVAYGTVSEAGPLNLAPTTSTTVMLALGDALCMTVLKRKGFSEEEFAKLHPGGDLGKRLLKCEDLMRTGDAHCIVQETLTVREVFTLYSAAAKRPGSATIVDVTGALAGIFTDSDLRRGLLRGDDFLDLPVREVMTRNPRCVLDDSSAREAFSLISTNKWDQVIVIDKRGLPVGLIDVQDLLRIFETS